MISRPWPFRLLFWLGICTICAGPSFMLGWDIFGSAPDQVAGMVLGILVWVGIYTWVTGTPRVRRMHRWPRVRLTFRIGYATRVGISVIFPAGLFVDAWCGFPSVWFAQLVTGGDESFAFMFVATVVQGGVLNVGLALYMGFVLGVQRLFGGPEVRDRGGCEACGYSLAGNTSSRCPECGLPVGMDPLEYERADRAAPNPAD